MTVRQQQICAACGTVGEAKTVTRGSLLIEIILWLCFLIPGLIYTVWRLTTRGRACASCSSSELVPVATPRGRELMARYNPGAAIVSSDDGLPPGNATRGYVYMAIIAFVVIGLIVTFLV